MSRGLFAAPAICPGCLLESCLGLGPCAEEDWDEEPSRIDIVDRFPTYPDPF